MSVVTFPMSLKFVCVSFPVYLFHSHYERLPRRARRMMTRWQRFQEKKFYLRNLCGPISYWPSVETVRSSVHPLKLLCSAKIDFFSQFPITFRSQTDSFLSFLIHSVFFQGKVEGKLPPPLNCKNLVLDFNGHRWILALNYSNVESNRCLKFVGFGRKTHRHQNIAATKRKVTT